MKPREPDCFVASGELQLAVYTWGAKPSAQTPREVLVLAHGFPDRALFWEQVAQALAQHYYVVAWDMRGCGQSTPVRGTPHYRFEPLLRDLYAVIDAVSPQQKVHLLGHDWGGIYGWDAICEDAGIRRIASFITFSPALDHVGLFLRRRLARPTPRHLAEFFSQLLRNSLMSFFTLPLLPELMFHSGLAVWLFRRLVGHFEPRIQFQKHEGMEGDAIRYLGIYRANLLRRTLFPRALHSPLPVHVLLAEHDPFLPPRVYEACAHSTARYSQSRLDAAHWAPLSRPQELAQAARHAITALAGA